MIVNIIDNTLKKERNMSKNFKAWLVILSISGFFCFEFFQINMFNALDPYLITTFKTNATTLSLLSSLYFYGTVLLIVPAGMLLDRLSPKKLILWALSFSLVGTVFFATADSIYIAALGRFLVGITGGPFGLLSTLKIASRWFPEQKLAFVTGIIIAVGMLGGILAQTPFTYLVDSIGWRQALVVEVICGVAILFTIWRVAKDYPEEKAMLYNNHTIEFKELGFVQGLFTVARKPQNWLCGIFASLLNLPIFLLGALWGCLYLEQVYGLDRMNASYITSMLYVGMLIGSPLFGKLSDEMKSRKKPMLLGNAICFITCLLVFANSSFSFTALAMLFFIIGFSSSAQIVAYPMVAESNPKYLTGSSQGLAAVIIMSGGAFFQPVFGWLMDRNWSGIIYNGIPQYSLENFQTALYIMPIGMIICFAALFFIKETNCCNEEHNFNKNTQSA